MAELDDLCAELTCGDDVRAEQAALRMSEIGHAALPLLRKLLQAQDADARWWAVRTLAGLEGIPESLPDLLTAMQDKSSEVRQAAAMAFCHRPDKQAVPALIQALSDVDAMTAKLASNALILVGSAATPDLLAVLSHGSATARLEAARALAEIKDPSAIPGLMKALETESALMQYWAGLGLDKLGVGMLYLKPE